MKKIKEIISHSMLQTTAQTTAEYALIILGAATLATLFFTWINDTNRVGRLFDAVLREVDKLIP